jgi:hypothetical protein
MTMRPTYSRVSSGKGGVMTSLNGMSSRAAFTAALPSLPAGWTVGYHHDRQEFVLHVAEHHRFIIRWRNTRPEGWVIYEGRPTKIFLNGSWDMTSARKKYVPDTFTDLVSAAMFVHLKAGV